MTETETTQATAAGGATHERCPCLEVADAVRRIFGVSPAVRHHLEQSRVEFLKAIREVLNERIERLSTPAGHGTKVAVE